MIIFANVCIANYSSKDYLYYMLPSQHLNLEVRNVLHFTEEKPKHRETKWLARGLVSSKGQKLALESCILNSLCYCASPTWGMRVWKYINLNIKEKQIHFKPQVKDGHISSRYFIMEKPSSWWPVSSFPCMLIQTCLNTHLHEYPDI